MGEKGLVEEDWNDRDEWRKKRYYKCSMGAGRCGNVVQPTKYNIGSRLCTAYLDVVTINNEVFVSPWLQGLYAGIEEIGINCCSQEVTSYFTSASVTIFFPRPGAF
jgi:hypothetical protein